jgi:hypothetical protein
LRLQRAGPALYLGAAAIEVGPRQADILIAYTRAAVHLVAAAGVPEAVSGKNGVVLLAGILHRVGYIADAISRGQFSGVQAPGIGQRAAQRRAAAGYAGVQRVVPAGFVCAGEIIDLEKIRAAGHVVDGHEADTEALIDILESQA